MEREDVRTVLEHRPFTPLRIHLTDGGAIDVPFSHVTRLLGYGVIVFKGVKAEGSYVAKGYQVVGFDRIDRIEAKSARGGGRKRKKAS